MATLQEHYNQINEGKGNKAQFLKQARELFPQHFNQYSDFNTVTNVLKSKQIISESKTNVVTKGFDIYDWRKILAEEVKAEEKTTSKGVIDTQKHAYDNVDMKNADNINFNEIMKGFYAELKDPKNHDKTGDEIKAMVVKNLAKDCLHYTKDGMFGEKGLGFTIEAPGLGTPKEPKGKFKSSGYGDIEKEVKVKSNVQDSLGDKEAKDSMPKKVKEMSVTPQNSAGVKKMKTPGTEKTIKLQESKLRSLLKSMIQETLNKPSDFDGTGLIVVGKSQIDNNAIADMLDETDFYGVWNSREGYWFFPEDEETLDSLEYYLDEEFSKRGINARFEGQFNESIEEILYNPNEIHGEYEIGDIVKYNGEEYKITRIIDDRIYIKNLKYGKRPDTWVKKDDLNKK
jgi:hypothetical protein